ncbi:MAG TPA: hypothetical protein VKG03_06125, partial [Solirubrobacterales bacterium]|nr:hypothetical protein [Solirubrobacterales bacterium]
GGSGGGAGGQGGGSGTAGPPQSANSSSPAASNGSSSSGGGGRSTGATTPSPSGQVTGTVNDTVSKVDESALGNSGVTGVTEGAVNGVAGPESPVGHGVDETVGAVGGLLPGNR